MGFIGDLFSLSVEVPPRKRLKVRFPLFPKRDPRILVKRRDEYGRWQLVQEKPAQSTAATQTAGDGKNAIKKPDTNKSTPQGKRGGPKGSKGQKTSVVTAPPKVIDTSTQTDNALEPCYHCAQYTASAEKSKKEKQNVNAKNKHKDAKQQAEEQKAKRVAFAELLKETPKYTEDTIDAEVPIVDARFHNAFQSRPIPGVPGRLTGVRNQYTLGGRQWRHGEQATLQPPRLNSQDWSDAMRAPNPQQPKAKTNAAEWKREEALQAARKADEAYLDHWLQQRGASYYTRAMEWLEQRDAIRNGAMIPLPQLTEPEFEAPIPSPTTRPVQNVAPDPYAQTIQTISNHRAPLQAVDNNSAHAHWDKRAAYRLVDDKENARKADQEAAFTWLAEQAAANRADAERAAKWLEEQAEARRREKILSVYRVDGAPPGRDTGYSRKKRHGDSSTESSRDRRHRRRSPRRDYSTESESRGRSRSRSSDPVYRRKKGRSKHGEKHEDFNQWPGDVQKDNDWNTWNRKTTNYRVPTAESASSHGGQNDTWNKNPKWNAQPRTTW